MTSVNIIIRCFRLITNTNNGQNFKSKTSISPSPVVLTGYDGGFAGRGGDGDGDVDGVAVEAGLAGPGGVLLVVGVLLLLSQTQAAAHPLQRAGGEAVVLGICLPLPGETDVCLITGVITLCSRAASSFLCQMRSI